MIINQIKNPNIYQALLDYYQMDETSYQDFVRVNDLVLCLDARLLDFVDKLKVVINNQEQILIVGDYDCDGIMATAILEDLFDSLNVKYGYYIPNRMKEGYGLNTNIVQLAYDKGYQNIITVDNGVKADSAISLANQLGIKVFISDHHQYDEEPNVHSFIHPNILSSYYQNCSGAAIALLIASHFKGYTPYHVSLASICVLSDVMPINNFNLDLLKLGLRYLNMQEARNISKILKANIDSDMLNFDLIPLVNSIGRMADKANVNTFIKFLKGQFNQEYYQKLIELNNYRKALVVSQSNEAKNLVNNDDNFIIIQSNNFHEGIVGILASKIANEYLKPVMVLSESEGKLKGSIRSIEGVDLVKLISPIKDSLLSFGGHAQAAGISFEVSYLDELKSYLNKALTNLEVNKTYQVISLAANQMNLDTYELANDFGPFGNKHEKPLFYSEVIINKVTILKDVHLKFTSEDNRTFLAFNANQDFFKLVSGQKVGIIYQLSKNEFAKRITIQGLVVDIKLI